MTRQAFATFLTGGSDGYLRGALALRFSLLEAGSAMDFLVLVDETYDSNQRDLLASAGCKVKVVAAARGAAVDRATRLCPWFSGVFGKLRLWEQSEYDKLVYLDADCLALQNLDHLFSFPPTSAVPDASRTDHFNSGVLVCAPSAELALRLMQSLDTAEAWDGGDQSILNHVFSSWFSEGAPPRLPLWYNHQAGRVPADSAERAELKVVHFYGDRKPWDASRGQRPAPPLHAAHVEAQFTRSVLPLLSLWYANARSAIGPGAPRRAFRKCAFATVVLDERQVPAALALKASLDATNPRCAAVALAASSLRTGASVALRRGGWDVRRVAPLQPAPNVLASLSLARLRLWQLTDYERVVYLAPTILALQDVTDLFDRPTLAAPPRAQRPDRPLADVVVLEPSERTFRLFLGSDAFRTAPTFERFLDAFFGAWFSSPSGHRLPQTDGLQLESALYLMHTECVPSLLRHEELRLVDFAPFLYGGRWLVTPDLRVEPSRALDSIRKGLRDAAAGIVPGASLPDLETIANGAAIDGEWARMRWEAIWTRAVRRLGIPSGPG